jgi:membrane protease YdiL (CAAX protease family)
MPVENAFEPAPDSSAGRDRLAARLRGFGPVGSLTTLLILLAGPVVEPLGALLALLWAHLSRTPWAELGLVRPRSWIGTALLGLGLGATFKLGMKAIVMPLLGADPINHAYHFLAGNAAALPGMIWDVTVGAGFGEELVFRGFMFERLGKLLGRGAGARATTVLISALWFGAIHYPVQGLAGAEQAVVTGLVFGAVFAATGRLVPLMFAHAGFDLTAVAIIYWDLESRVAHLIFR